MEETDVVQEMVVCDDGGWKVSQGTQTGSSDLVQIKASHAEMLRRIESFVRYKRQQVDVYNQMEFCHHSDVENTCARVDASYVKRGSSSSHIETVRTHNECGPNASQATPLELLQRDLTPPSRKMHSSALLGLPERLSNLEKYLDLYADGITPRDMVERIKRLEMRVLELEGHSPEYQQSRHEFSLRAPMSVPQLQLSRDAPRPPQGHPALFTSSHSW